MKNRCLTLLLLLTPLSLSAQKSFEVVAPSGDLTIVVTVDDAVRYSVYYDGEPLVDPSAISMTLQGGAQYGVAPKLLKSSKRSVDEVITTPLYKHSQIDDVYNELTLKFRGDYNITFRAYDDGVAYRFESTSSRPFKVISEQATFNFADNYPAYIPYVNPGKTTVGGTYRDIYEPQYTNTFENYYTHIPLNEWDVEKLCYTPIVLQASHGRRILIAESDLMGYPGMYLCNDNGSTTLTGKFATYPKTIEQGGHNMLQGLVKEREEYIAQCDGARSFPWRIVQVAQSDMQLADNNIVYKLASPSQEPDTSWIKPGKVAWDWWNANNLYGVDFEAGVNNDTYKYFIDFASENGVEYVILDEGWAVNLEADLLQVIPEIDLEMLSEYAEARGVGLILWAGYWALERDMEAVCSHYAAMGIKGFKVDFMDRDDQPMVEFYQRAAQMGLKYKLLLDFHGAYKPTGLNRTYPNIVNYEAVKGLEYMKWSKSPDQLLNETIIPFIRMAAGPLDYTQGAMRNANMDNFYPSFTEPMSQGTRARQLALYSIFESPLNMLCDSPSNYLREKECFEYIAEIPTTWDQTEVVNGLIGEYITIARRAGDEWYLGSITSWDARELQLDLSFLGDGEFTAIIFRDGANASHAARDYKREQIDIPADRLLDISLSSGGGYAMKISRRE